MRALRWGTVALAVVAVVGVGAAIYLSSGSVDVLKYQQEWVKALLQAGLIAVLGVVTTGVLETFKDGLQRGRDRSKLRFDVLGDIGTIYMDVKLVRRRAQSVGGIDPIEIPGLNDRQVRLELHKHNSSTLFSQSAALSGALTRMEQYLNRAANDPASDERLRFLLSDGFREFSSAFREAIAIMQRDIGGRS